jgi:hypothetical protein
MAVRLSALRAGHPLPPKKIPGTHFSYRMSRPHDHSAAWWIRSIEKSSDLIGKRTRDFPGCSVVPRPITVTALSKAWTVDSNPKLSRERSQWPLSRKLGLWIRIPLKAWVSVCVYSVFVLSCVQLATLSPADPPSKESYGVYEKIMKLKNRLRSNKRL